jgi:hypothetical protein
MSYQDIKQCVLDRLYQTDFQQDNYFKEQSSKNQIVLHHTAGRDNARGMYNYWGDSNTKIATCVGIQDDGNVYQGFHSSYWGYHLGVSGNTLDKRSVAIEICNWGGLKKKNGKYYAWPDDYSSVTVPEEKVIEYPQGFRGFKYYERYTIEEIKSLRLLILLWAEDYNICLNYNSDMWQKNDRALTGENGIWTHVSYRDAQEKQDCHPQPELITMLKKLKD